MLSTYPALLADRAAAAPDRIFLRANDETGAMTELTYAELDRRSTEVAAGLQALGLAKGDRVAIAAPNVIEWLELFFGATRAGIVLVTLNIRYRESELEYMLAQSGSKVLVSSAKTPDLDFEQFYADRAELFPTVEHYFFLGSQTAGKQFAELRGDGSAFVATDLSPDDPAVILYTSGTTGRPKGATLTHGSMIASGSAQAQHTGLAPDDSTVSVMPLNHVGGITCGITTTLWAGATISLLPMYSPEGTLADLEKYGATAFGGVPTMWRLMLDHPSYSKYDTSSLRHAIIGGSNADPTLCRDIQKAYPKVKLFNLYGLSESSGAAVLSADDDTVEEVVKYIGVPIPNVEARIVDVDGRVLAAGETGELQLRTPSVAAGYWEMPEQTADTFLDGGWLATGDIAEMTEDGHIALRGRLKEMYLQGGYNVYPVEVENLLNTHPGVAMSAGIGVPDEVLGEVGRYFVVRQPGAEVTEQELLELCREKLANYKVPRQLIFVDEMPLTPSGKISKAELKNR